MSRLSLGASVAITVLVTLALAGVAYTSVRIHTRSAAQVQSPTPPAAISPKPVPTPAPPSENPSPGSAVMSVIGQDLVDARTGWLLVSDCPSRAKPTCRVASVRTVDGAQSWSRPVQIGPVFSITDPQAPQKLAFMNRHDGFAYSQMRAFVTHDAGSNWRPLGVPAVFVSGIAMSPDTVWLTTYPCTKGTTCGYDIRSSRDGGRTWSTLRRLPVGLTPEGLAAYPTGVLVYSPVAPFQMELTTDGGVTWADLTAPCPANSFRNNATTADGVEIWVACYGNPVAAGAFNAQSLFVSANGGKTWVRRDLHSAQPQWLLSPRAHVAFAGAVPSTIVSRDSGISWSAAVSGNVQFETIRFNGAGWGWALDLGRNLWTTEDAGAHWTPIRTLPDRLS